MIKYVMNYVALPIGLLCCVILFIVLCCVALLTFCWWRKIYYIGKVGVHPDR